MSLDAEPLYSLIVSLTVTVDAHVQSMFMRKIFNAIICIVSKYTGIITKVLLWYLPFFFYSHIKAELDKQFLSFI